MYKEATKQEALRLRQQQRLSLREIQAQTGVSKGTLSKWLQGMPLDREEVRAKLRLNGTSKGRAKADRVESALHRRFGVPMNSHYKAKIAEAAILLRAGLLGVDTYQSPFDGDKADWVFDVKGRLLKGQVKWAATPAKHGAPQVKVRCAGCRSGLRCYTEGEFDILVGYDLYTDTAYVWTWDEVKDFTSTVSCWDEAEERWDKITVS